MAGTIAQGIAALVNTYGGLLLVGVTDDRELKGVKEKTIESVAEHCAAKLEPPWIPPIVPVRLRYDADLNVLVLRVVPGQRPRPLLVKGVPPCGTRTPPTRPTGSGCATSEMSVTAVAEALDRSPLTEAMADLVLDVAYRAGSDSFSPEGLNRSRTVTLAWSCAPDGWPQDRGKPVRARVRLEMPASYGHVNQDLNVEIDVVVQRGASAESIREQPPAIN